VTRASEAGSARTVGHSAAGSDTASGPFEAALLADAPSIGDGIRGERLRRGLTLAQLASQVHLTVSALSQIERGASDPSISSLRRIASAFGIPMFQFLVGTGRREIVVRRNHRTRLTFPDREVEYDLVSADTIGEFEVLGLTLTAGGASSQNAIPHASEECAIVLRGHVLAEVAGRTYELDAGDSIKIHRELPHRFVNQSSAEAELILIISPPTF
jgi:transcriptional regulator with XRE-family HTH domain